jgi:hypothetical protein
MVGILDFLSSEMNLPDGKFAVKGKPTVEEFCYPEWNLDTSYTSDFFFLNL